MEKIIQFRTKQGMFFSTEVEAIYSENLNELQDWISDTENKNYLTDLVNRINHSDLLVSNQA